MRRINTVRQLMRVVTASQYPTFTAQCLLTDDRAGYRVAGRYKAALRKAAKS